MINKVMKSKILKHLLTISPELDINEFEIYHSIISQHNITEQYTEKHHILPKSLFPEFRLDKQNIIKLSAEDHFLAHYQLFKMMPNNPQMVAAMWGMCNQISPTHQREFLNQHKNELATIYAEVRSAHSKNVKERQLANNTMKGKKGNLSPFYGVPRKKSTIKKMKDNHWSTWRKPWEHNRANKKVWLLATMAYDLWVENNRCGYVKLDTLLNMPDQSFKTILEHFRKDWNPHIDLDFQNWYLSKQV
jgi:hypothetical protein